MTKAEAIKIFGKTQSDLARHIPSQRGGVLTQAGIAKWHDPLTQREEDLVRGAARRHNKRIRL